MRLNKGFKAGVIAVSLAAVVTGCGSARSDDPTSSGDGASTAPAEAASFGDLESPCGEGDASGATDQGVTDDSIAIGYGDDRGFVSAPGLSQEGGDAVDAMVKWCNEQGGINGRELVGTRYDAAISNMVPVMKEACAKEFMLVGDGFANDFAGDPIRVARDYEAALEELGYEVTSRTESPDNLYFVAEVDDWYISAGFFPDPIRNAGASVGVTIAPAGTASGTE